MSKLHRLPLLSLLAALFLLNASVCYSQTCNLANLETRRLSVGEVTFHGSFDEIAEEKGIDLTVLKNSLPIQKGRLFVKTEFEAAVGIVNARFNSTVVNNEGGFRKTLPSTEIVNCRSANLKQVDVVFHLYDFNFEDYPAREGNEKISQKTSANKFTKFLRPIAPQPYVGFDNARHVYAGSAFSVDLKNNVFQRGFLEVEGSSSSAVVVASLEGDYQFENKWLNHAEWSGGFQYSDLPADVLKIKKGNFYARGSINAPLMKIKNSRESFLTLGMALEGGNRQTDLSVLNPLLMTIDDSRYGSLKTYAGVDLSFPHQDLKISYGLQLANSGNGLKVEYLKQIFDSAYSAKIPFALPLTVEARFTAGDIVLRSGKIPIPERFFGGGNKQNFIPGSSWEIQGGPLIRSFPTNALNRTGATVFTGGDSFVSTNLTLAATVWSKPLIPREVRTEILTKFNDQSFIDLLRAASEPGYIPETKDYPALIVDVQFDTMQKVAQSIADKMDELSAEPLSDEAGQKVETALDLAEETVSIVKSAKNSIEKTLEIRELVIKSLDPSLPAGSPGTVKRLLTALTSLIDTNDPEILSEKTALEGLQTSLENSFRVMKNRYDAFVISGTGLVQAQNEFDRDIQYMQSTLRTLTNDLHLFAVSPALMFDAARLDSKSEVIKYGFRYGIGPAVRFEFLGVNLTTGYAFNPRRLPGERRGSFVFSFDVTDLFK